MKLHTCKSTRGTLPAESVPAQPTPAGARFSLYRGDALNAYSGWPRPNAIISDGAYGLGGFPGDPLEVDILPQWYDGHARAWSAHALPSTALWFWNTEQGWASVHPLLTELGWVYEQTIIWDKGLSHVAGNSNGRTLRRFPVVTEVCALYSRKLELPTGQSLMPAQQWLRHEWRRSGLPLNLANEACGVRNAATRKYLTGDRHWYFPPPEMLEKMARYANRHGRPANRPYFSLDGESPPSAAEWRRLRYKWNFEHGITNVWNHPPVNGKERYRGNGLRSNAAAHLNQKPLDLMRRIIRACTDAGDVVWEPFGGLCTGSAAAVELKRRAYAAEKVTTFADIAEERLKNFRLPDNRIPPPSPRITGTMLTYPGKGCPGIRKEHDLI